MAEQADTTALTKQQEATAVSADPEAPPPGYTTDETPNYGTTDTVPPSYNQSQNDAPPSYESLYGKIKAKKRESSGFMNFMKNMMVLLLGTLGCTICVGLVLAIPISMIVIGAIYKDQCRVERFIPIYLIVGGVFGVLKNLSNFGQRIRNRQNEQDDENAKTNPFDGVISCFLFAWFIAGNVWIYRVYTRVVTDNIQDPNYCHPTCYFFAFWITTATYILLGLTCLCVCCAGAAGAAISPE